MGWIFLVVILFILGSIVGLFPRALPRPASEKMLRLEESKPDQSKAVVSEESESQKVLFQPADESQPPNPEDLTKQNAQVPASLKDMFQTFKRLLTNKILLCNNAAAVFYAIGGQPYWIFLPKYIETQYKQSSSLASLVTGTVGLVFSAFGILIAGIVIAKFKPKARYLAVWNVIVGGLTVMAVITFAFLGCSAGDKQVTMSDFSGTVSSCNGNCHCDYVRYHPVCSEDGRTFISACHAGCKTLTVSVSLISDRQSELFGYV